MRLGIAAMPMVGAGSPLVTIVLEGDEGAGGRTVDDREPSLGHLPGMIAAGATPAILERGAARRRGSRAV
jgi:hypothetical protein